MPHTFPVYSNETGRFALVLAFGKLSVLEACTVVQGIKELEQPSERVCVVQLAAQSSRRLTKLAGVHKLCPLAVHFHGDEEAIGELVEIIAAQTDVSKFALSGYDVPENDYEALVRMLLDAFRDRGFKKIRLLRPKGNELMAEEVLSRGALDIIAFPYRGGYDLGPTAWVPDMAMIRTRTLSKPSPAPEISMSPRLAQALVNLSGLSPGQTLLDPFCGSGTILAEGLSRSLTCIGVDSSPARIRDARRNLEWAKRMGGKGTFILKTGDARDLPSVLGGTKADGVVTEPVLLPTLKARLSSSVANELMEAAGDTYARALYSIADVLNPGARVVMVVPVLQTTDRGEVSIDLDARQVGLTQLQPGPVAFQYPMRLAFESTRWLKRAVYVFESRS